MVETITVTIKRTFTEKDDPFGLFSLLEATGDLSIAETEMRYDLLQRDDNDDGLGRLRFVDALLDDAVYEIKSK